MLATDQQYRLKNMRHDLLNSTSSTPPSATHQGFRELLDAFPLFQLTPEIVLSIRDKDRKPQLEGLQDCGLLHLPYERVAVRFPFRESSLSFDNRDIGESGCYVTAYFEGPLSLRTVVTTPPEDKSAFAHGQQKLRVVVKPETLWDFTYWEYADGHRATQRPGEIEKREGYGDDMVFLCCDAVATLVLALATRNIVKRTSINTRAARGLRPKAKFFGPEGVVYVSRTLLQVPEQMEDDAEHPPGKSKRPHMRRGHIHTVAHGVGRTERRKQWFPAVFVNADSDFVMAGRRYRIVDVRKKPAEL